MFPIRRSRRLAPAIAESKWSEEHAADIIVYQLLWSRMLEHDAKVWQVPTLTLTAQAFLMTITLSVDYVAGAHVAAAALGAIIALLAAQLMMKHRYYQRIDIETLEGLERRMGLRAFTRHSATDLWSEGFSPHPSRVERYRSTTLWVRALVLLAVFNIAMVPLGWLSPEWLIKGS